jgi:hypothetical protein
MNVNVEFLVLIAHRAKPERKQAKRQAPVETGGPVSYKASAGLCETTLHSLQHWDRLSGSWEGEKEQEG